MLYRVHDKMYSGSRKSEIVTLQFGQYANHVGAHFWNFQDELIGLSTPSEELENVEEEEEEVTRKTRWRTKPVQRDRPRVFIPSRRDETRGNSTNAEMRGV